MTTAHPTFFAYSAPKPYPPNPFRTTKRALLSQEGWLYLEPKTIVKDRLPFGRCSSPMAFALGLRSAIIHLPLRQSPVVTILDAINVATARFPWLLGRRSFRVSPDCESLSRLFGVTWVDRPSYHLWTRKLLFLAYCNFPTDTIWLAFPNSQWIAWKPQLRATRSPVWSESVLPLLVAHPLLNPKLRGFTVYPWSPVYPLQNEVPW
jgi:hypothetical protein